MADITLRVNGSEKKVSVSPETPLLGVLRDTLDLPSTKFACGAGLCGACTVHVEGSAVQACSTPVSQCHCGTYERIRKAISSGGGPGDRFPARRNVRRRYRLAHREWEDLNVLAE